MRPCFEVEGGGLGVEEVIHVTELKGWRHLE